LGIEKNTLRFGKKVGINGGLNSFNTLIPNKFLETSGDLKFGGDYPHYPHKSSSTKQSLIDNLYAAYLSGNARHQHPDK
jgi:hypothetical protein